MTARVFMIVSHYLGVRLVDEMLKTDDEIVGVVADRVRQKKNDHSHLPLERDVRAVALENYLPLYEPKPSKLNSPEFLAVIRKTKPDYIVSGYYAKIFSDDLLSIPAAGCVNLHPAKLPDLRGMTPHFTHMLMGYERNWITMHWLDAGVDTGDIIARASIEIKPEDTGFRTGRLLSEAGAEMFREYWPQVKSDTAPRLVQDESQANTFNFSWDLAEINWTQPATQIWNLVRTLTRPLGGAWSIAGGYKMRVWAIDIVDPDSELVVEKVRPGQVLAMTGSGLWVQCGEGQIRILDAAFDDRPEMSPFELLAQLYVGMPVLLG